MFSIDPSCSIDRRQFLHRLAPLGCLSCFGSRAMFHKSVSDSQENSAPHKFKADSLFTFEEVFQFAIVEDRPVAQKIDLFGAVPGQPQRF